MSFLCKGVGPDSEGGVAGWLVTVFMYQVVYQLLSLHNGYYELPMQRLTD